MVLFSERPPSAGDVFPGFFLGVVYMAELSIFVDESGSDDLREPYYLLTLVFHNQDASVREAIGLYEQSLIARDMPNIPFHATPLMTGHCEYEGLALETRSRLLNAFRVFVRHLPIRYKLFEFRMKEFGSKDDMSRAMRKRFVEFFFDNLSSFQAFDEIKIYYDGGQGSITDALHKAVDLVFFKSAVVYRSATASEYRLSQVADSICTLELAARKYRDHRLTPTYEKFFGGWQKFKKGPYKELLKLRME